MSDTSTWLTNNSGGSGHPNMKFKDVGDFVSGTIDGDPRIVDHTDLDGNPTQSLVIDITVSKGHGVASAGPDNDVDVTECEAVTVWVKKGAMATAIKGALAKAGAKGLSDGALLAVKHHELGEQKKAGFNRPKLYEASYKPAVASVSIEEF